MATNVVPSCTHADEDYIDIEVSSLSSSTFFCYSTTSPPAPPPIEFEFQMSSSTTTPHERETTTSPADELFYKGNLLPLHLPPRLQMVQKLLQNPTFDPFEYKNCKMTPTPSTNTNPPLESCRFSTELNPDDYLFQWSTDLRGLVGDNPKESWSKKLNLNLVKRISLVQKIKSSMKSFFGGNSGCSDESHANEACNVKGNESIKVRKMNPFGQIGKGNYPTLADVMKTIDKDGVVDGVDSHRKSFSGAVKWHSTTKCSSSSSSLFSLNSNGFYELQFFRRSSSASSEIEGSIESAIAHCKKSQNSSLVQQVH